MAETKGIGRLVDLCIEALETGDVSKMEKRKDEKTGGMKSLWDYEIRGHKTAEPAPRGPRPVGSFNFGPVANLCELILSKGQDARAAGWLEAYYRRQGPDGDLGHMGWEALSHVYGGPLLEAALLIVAAGKRWAKDFRRTKLSEAAEQAGRLLSRELALCLLHRAPGGRIIHAGTRSKMKGAGLTSPAREDFVDGALWGAKGQSRIDRLMRLSNWSAPIAMHDAAKRGPIALPVPPDQLQPYLSEIRLAPGPLTVTHFENGHVSRWETGPICYQSPMPANVGQYEPRVVEPFLRPGKGQQEGLRTSIDSGMLTIESAVAADEHLILDDRSVGLDLGAVVAEHRIEGIQL